MGHNEQLTFLQGRHKSDVATSGKFFMLKVGVYFSGDI